MAFNYNGSGVNEKSSSLFFSWYYIIKSKSNYKGEIFETFAATNNNIPKTFYIVYEIWWNFAMAKVK